MNSDIVAAAEHRLQLSIDRLMALDTRAGVFLGLILTVGGTLAALTRPTSASHQQSTLPVIHPWANILGFILMLVAAILAALALTITSQLDNPRVNDIPRLLNQRRYSEYIDSVDRAVYLNNANASHKAMWLQFSLIALFSGVVCILFVGGAVT